MSEIETCASRASLHRHCFCFDLQLDHNPLADIGDDGNQRPRLLMGWFNIQHNGTSFAPRHAALHRSSRILIIYSEADSNLLQETTGPVCVGTRLFIQSLELPSSSMKLTPHNNVEGQVNRPPAINGFVRHLRTGGSWTQC